MSYWLLHYQNGICEISRLCSLLNNRGKFIESFGHFLHLSSEISHLFKRKLLNSLFKWVGLSLFWQIFGDFGLSLITDYVTLSGSKSWLLIIFN